MLRLVMHHTYNNGRATDVSATGNHGLPIATTPGAGGAGFDSSLRFDQPASEVRIARSSSLSKLDAIQLRVRFFWRPGDAHLGRRHNLAEGHLSFALFVTPYGGLDGTIVDATGSWRGASAPKGTVSIAQWHEAEMRHDGFSTLEIFLDGVLVGATYDVRGPVRGVGPHGISVGHWPEPDHRYTYRGFIDHVKLAKREIEPEDVLDPCCNDPKTIDDLIADMRDDGFTAEKARALLDQVKALEAEIRSAVAGGDGARAQRIRELANQGALAIQSGSSNALMSAANRTVSFMQERMSQAALENFGQRALDILVQAPHGDLLRRFADGDMSVLRGAGPVLSALCLPHPPEGRDRGDKDRHPEPEGDPHTDHGRPGIIDQLDHTLEPTDEPAPYDGKPPRSTRSPREQYPDTSSGAEPPADDKPSDAPRADGSKES